MLPDIELSPNLKYVIIDDDDDMLENQVFLRTNWETGLTDEDVEKCKKYLK